MKENEFDIYVRDLMTGAEETVSPEVWKGVAAGLDKAARKRAVPMWVWRSVAGVAAAAAVVAGIVLFTPEKNLSNQPNIPTPVAEATDDPLPVLNEPEGVAITPIAQQVTRLRGVTAYVPEILVEEETAVTEEITEEPAPAEPERTPETVLPPVPQQDAVSSVEEAFNRLAFEERKAHRRGSFSTGILGNIQSNTRPESPASTIRRTASMFAPAPTKTGLYDERPEFSFGLPVSAGVSFRYDFSPRWGIGTGIVYTNLSRSFMASYAEVGADGSLAKNLFDTDVTNQQHYLGIPLNLYFNIVNTGNWNFHVRMDGMAEKLIHNDFLVHDSEGDIRFNQPVDNFQYSAGFGIGVEFKFTPYLGLYLDPTIRYYFDCSQPRSIRTIQPLRMDFEAGLRFTLGQ